jgi:hypothetical protein
MEKEKIKEVVLQQDELLNGIEAFAIIEGLKLFNEQHKKDVKSFEDKGKNPLIGKNYFETMINHGLLWKLKKFCNIDDVKNLVELQNGKI